MNGIRMFRCFTGFLLAGLLVTPLTLFAQDSRPVFSYPIDSDALIISYNSIPEMLGNPDLTPRIRVYGDGWVQVHYPMYMKKAGDYEVQLNPGEIRQLLLALSGVFDFDPKAVKNSRKAIKEAREQQTGVAYYRSEDTLDQFEVNLDTYQSGPAAVARSISLSFAWKNIEADAKDYPEVKALQKLAGARESLSALLDRDDLVKLDTSTGGQL